jgi:hypothetical protein
MVACNLNYHIFSIPLINILLKNIIIDKIELSIISAIINRKLLWV